jgi:RNA polymerase sigma factor (TIGR02999 family)
MSDVTRILSAIEEGDPHAAGQLLPLVYDELRKLAAAKLAQEQPGQTIQATALVHEAYLRLVDVDRAQHWDSRRHFFAAAAESMRRILVESARRKNRSRHGGHYERVPLVEDHLVARMPPDELIELDEALTLLEQQDPAAAELVKLRFFAGMTLAEAAHSLGISERTAYRDWSYARAWLFRHLGEAVPSDTD